MASESSQETGTKNDKICTKQTFGKQRDGWKHSSLRCKDGLFHQLFFKDYVFLSPEIQPYVCDVQLDWSRFSDHAVIQVHLTDLGRPALVPMWRKPTAIDWPTKPQHVVHWPHQAEYSENTDEWYRNIWHNVERLCLGTLPGQ